LISRDVGVTYTLTRDPVSFTRVGERYGEFSNFAPFPIRLKNTAWPTSEPCFQAPKFAGTSQEEEIRRVQSPMPAARMGRSRRRPLRKDREKVKHRIMLDALRAKFEQHPELKGLLLGTGETRIVEHTSNDAYWGDGGDGSGLNRPGELLMRRRSLLGSV
jgi:ribA/ribD-fused uncharacterized protein